MNHLRLLRNQLLRRLFLTDRLPPRRRLSHTSIELCNAEVGSRKLGWKNMSGIFEALFGVEATYPSLPFIVLSIILPIPVSVDGCSGVRSR